MANLDVDLLVIGFGKAGKTLAMKRGAAGDRVALVELDPKMHGGTCINIACVPTKTLLTSARRWRESQAADPGADKGSAADDAAFTRAQDHRDAFIAKLNAANTKMVEGKGVTIVTGKAEFVGERQVRVVGGEDELTITGETVVINTGAEPIMPKIPGIDSPRVVDSTAIQHVSPRPQRLVIIGAGPIGLEFATMFSSAGFGSEVTVLNREEDILPRVDADVRDSVREQLDAAGITIVGGAEVTAIDSGQDYATVRYSKDGQDQATKADAVLVAIGRKPRTAGLGLEKAGVKVGERGEIVVDEHRRTSADGVYAAGDVVGGPQFTYVSFDDFRIIASDRWGDGSRTAEGRLIPTTTFLEPPLSQVGMSEEEAAKDVESRGHTLDVRAGNVAELAVVPRPKILGQAAGRVKFLVDKEDDRILGATLYCVDSQELINTVALAMRENIAASALGGGIYTHPATSEVFNALLA